MMRPYENPSLPSPPARRWGRRLGRVLSVLVVGAAGAGGWFGLDQAMAEDDPTPSFLPSIDDGLVPQRLATGDRWNYFTLRYEEAGVVEQQWFDMDRLAMRREVGGFTLEILDDRAAQQDDTGTWLELEPETTTSAFGFLALNTGPFALTDIFPPAVVPYTTLRSVSENDGERTYRVHFDTERLRAERYFDFHWWANTGPWPDSVDEWSITVGADGYVTKVLGGNKSRTWERLDGPFELEAPLFAGS